MNKDETVKFGNEIIKTDGFCRLRVEKAFIDTSGIVHLACAHVSILHCSITIHSWIVNVASEHDSK